jgi:transposase, IS30 family
MSHLTLEQRYTIAVLLKNKESLTNIAMQIGCHKSTVSRELKRNIGSRGRNAKIYDAYKSQQKTDQRHRLKNKRIKFDSKMKEYIKSKLMNEKWSPEIISVKGHQKFGKFVSLETIYSWIWKMKSSHKSIDLPYRNLFAELKHGKRRQKRGNANQNRGCIPDRKSIEDRPKVVDKRERLGDVEVDLVMGKDNQPGLLVITERSTLITSMKKIKNKKANYIAIQLINQASKWKHWLKTMTYDNDLSFACHKLVNEKLGTESYFTRPYCAQDKGTIENRIGIIRRYFPKKIDFSKITAAQVKKVERFINSRPVRKFGYLSPDEFFIKKLDVAFIT